MILPFLLIALFLAYAQTALAQPALPLQRARESFAEYQKEDKAKQDALAQGTAAQADAHGAAARKALLDAQRAYEAIGVPAHAAKDVLFEYANVTQLLGYYDLAGEAMEAAVRLDPNDARAWGVLGASEIECGPKHEPRGLEALRKSLALDGASKESSAVSLALGKFYTSQHLYEFAGEALDKALAADPGNVEAVLRRAALDVRAGKILEGSTAIDKLEKAAQPFDALTRVLLRETLAVFEADGGYFEDNHDNHAAYAKLLYRAGRLPEAILAASRAVHLDQKDVKTLNFLASMYMQAGNADAARQACEKSLSVDPNQPAVQELMKQLPPAAPSSPSVPVAPAAPEKPGAAPPPFLQK